jgi:hypothetical protein
MVDFVENYTFAKQNEIEKQYFGSVQLIILVHISHQWNSEYLKNPSLGAPKLVTEYYYYMSNDPNHGMLFVKHFYDLLWKHLTDRGVFYN